MPQQKIEDFLTKQLFISKNIVTYRLLSRELGVHVNVAKNELAAFYTKVTKSPDQSCSATYLISGEYKFPFPYDVEDTDTGSKRKKRENGWSLDMDSDSSPYDLTQSQSQSQSQLKPQESVNVEGRKGNGEFIAKIRLTVVGEAGLQDAKAKYTKVNSVTLYSLSPAPVRDADLLCESSRKIREIDNQKGMEFAKTVGRIIGKGIEMKAGITKPRGRPTAATTSSAKPALAVPKVKVEPGASESASASAVTAAAKVEEKEKEPANDKPKLKARQTGKIDFFVPKPQSQPKEKEIKGSKGKMFFGANDSPKLASSTKEKTPMLTPAPSLPSEEKIEPLKRGAKRKSDIADPPDEGILIKSTSAAAAPSRALSRQSSNPPSMRSGPQATKAISKLRLCKNAIVSDEDEAQPQKKTTKRSRRQVTHVSEDEDNNSSRDSVRALESMMDMDDDQVEKAPRKPKRRLEEEEDSELEQEALEAADQDGDVRMSDVIEAKPKPRPRKKKEKVVPVGQNGLKKRCIMKSRMRVDEKGYMVTEDYSSYESVEEEEGPEKIVSTNKGGGKRTVGTKKEYSTIESVLPEDTAVNPTSNSETRFQTTANVVPSSAKAAPSRSKGGQKQKTLNTFFGAPKPQK